MRFFDDEKIGVFLDDIGHRIERTKDGQEIKMVDLTLRVQPFTPELAVSLDPDVRALLFSMNDATPKPKIKAMEFKLPTPRQTIAVFLLPELDTAQLDFTDVEITSPRARTEKGIDGFALIFYASIGPLSARELESICDWLTQQRFLTFQPQQPALDLQADETPRRRPRRAGPLPIETQEAQA
jgi:hypothetical protein